MLRALIVLLNVVVALTWAATATSSVVAVSILQAAPLCDDAEAGCEEEDEFGLDEEEPLDDEPIDGEEPFDDEDFSDFDELDDEGDEIADFEDFDDDNDDNDG